MSALTSLLLLTATQGSGSPPPAPSPTVAADPTYAIGETVIVTVANGPGDVNNAVALLNTGANPSTTEPLQWAYLKGGDTHDHTLPVAPGVAGGTVSFSTSGLTSGTYDVALIDAPDPSWGGDQVERFDFLEVAVINSNSYSNVYDYTVVELVATLTRPSPLTALTIYGFYDGGTSWKIRLRADAVGAHSYTLAWQGSGSHPAAPAGGSFTCVDRNIHRGPLRVASDNPWYFEDARGQPFHVRSYAMDTMLWYTATHNITLETATLKGWIDTYIAARGHNFAMWWNCLGCNKWTDSSLSGGGPVCNYPVGYWGAVPNNQTQVADLTRYSISVFAAFENVLLHLRDAGVQVIFNELLCNQVSVLSVTNAQKLGRYIMARTGAFYNLTGCSPVVEWPDAGVYTVANVESIMSFIHASDPYNRLLTCHDVSYSTFTAWLNYSTTQGPFPMVTQSVASTNTRRSGQTHGVVDPNGSAGVGNPFINKPVVFGEWSWMCDATYRTVASDPNWQMPDSAITMIRNVWGVILCGGIPVASWWSGWQTKAGNGLPLNLDLGEAALRAAYDLIYTQTTYRQWTQQNGTVTSGKFCSGISGVEYITYSENGGTWSITLPGTSATAYDVTWFNAATGASQAGSQVLGGSSRSLASPYGSTDSVALLKSTTPPPPAGSGAMDGAAAINTGTVLLLSSHPSGSNLGKELVSGAAFTTTGAAAFNGAHPDVAGWLCLNTVDTSSSIYTDLTAAITGIGTTWTIWVDVVVAGVASYAFLVNAPWSATTWAEPYSALGINRNGTTTQLEASWATSASAHAYSDGVNGSFPTTTGRRKYWAIRNGTNLKLGVDGAQVGADIVCSALSTFWTGITSNRIAIGNSGSSGAIYGTNGLFLRVQIWNTAKTTADMAALNANPQLGLI